MVLKKTRLLFIAGSLCKRRKANEYFLLTAIRSVKNLIVILSNILPLFNLTPQCKKAKCMMKQFYTLHIPPQGHKASIQHQKRFWLAASALIKRNIGDFSFPDSRSKTACRATPARAASSTPAAYRARRFTKSPLTHFAASPLRKRSRSVRLLGCKRPRDGSLSLPTFCEKKEGAFSEHRTGGRGN